MICGLHLQRNALADKVAQHCQVLRFFFQEQVDDFLRSQDAKLARIELLRLAHQFTQNLVADGAAGFYLTFAGARGARFAQNVGQRFARAFARHLHQA